VENNPIDQGGGAVNELALFAGGGGGLLGGALCGFKTVCAVEKESYCREVLLRRQLDGMLPVFPIWSDARTFDGRPWRGVVDIVTAGFPCQPFSVAGGQKRQSDDRNMWPDTIRIIREVGPKYVLLENVPGLLAADYFGQILGDLAEAGFDARWEIISAASCGAPHRRDRVWIVAHAHGAEIRDDQQREARGRDDVQDGRDAESRYHGEEKPLANANSGRCELEREPEHDRVEGPSRDQSDGLCPERRRGGKVSSDVEARYAGAEGPLADSSSLGMEGSWTDREQESPVPSGSEVPRRDGAGSRTEYWLTEPDVGRVAHGVAHRVDRLRTIGNGQVPAVVREAWSLKNSD